MENESTTGSLEVLESTPKRDVVSIYNEHRVPSHSFSCFSGFSYNFFILKILENQGSQKSEGSDNPGRGEREEKKILSFKLF